MNIGIVHENDRGGTYRSDHKMRFQKTTDFRRIFFTSDLSVGLAGIIIQDLS